MELGPLKAVATAAVIVGAFVWTERITAYNPPPGPIEITYWEKWTEFEFDAMKKVVDTFNASQNKIHVRLLSVSGIENKTLMAIAGGEPPDVAGLYGANLAQYADDNAILDLTDYCRKNGITRDQYIPVFFDMCTYRGRVWAMPSTPASTALHYNKKMLAAAGITEPPKTIEEMDADCDRIYKRDSNGNLIAAGFLPQEPGWWNYAWAYMFGGSLWDGGERITANSPENVKAFAWIQSFSTKYGVSALQNFRNGFGAFSSPENAFMQEKVAMEIQGVWMANFIEKYDPTLSWGAVPFPYPQDRPDLKGRTIADLDILTIPRGARHPKEAFEFIKFVESQKGMEMLCLGQHKNSPLISVSPGFYEHHPNKFIRLFEEGPKGKNTITVPKMGIWPEYSAELNNAVDEVTKPDPETPQQALDEVQNRIQPEWTEYRKRLRQRGVLR